MFDPLPSQAKDVHFKAPEVALYPRFIRARKRIKSGIAERVNKINGKIKTFFLGPAYPLRTPRTKLSTKNDPMMISVTK